MNTQYHCLEVVDHIKFKLPFKSMHIQVKIVDNFLTKMKFHFLDQHTSNSA